MPPTPEVRKTWIEGVERDLADPDTHLVCVVDTDLPGEPVIAFANWKSPVAATKPPPGDGYPKGGDEELSAFFFRHLTKERLKRIAGRKCWYLACLCCHEAHQGKGAGSMLMRYGMDRIEEDGADGYIEASPPGVPVYKKFGFHEVDRLVLWDGKWTELMMFREATKK